jgi:hypothetical protein
VTTEESRGKPLWGEWRQLLIEVERNMRAGKPKHQGIGLGNKYGHTGPFIFYLLLEHRGHSPKTRIRVLGFSDSQLTILSSRCHFCHSESAILALGQFQTGLPCATIRFNIVFGLKKFCYRLACIPQRNGPKTTASFLHQTQP